MSRCTFVTFRDNTCPAESIPLPPKVQNALIKLEGKGDFRSLCPHHRIVVRIREKANVPVKLRKEKINAETLNEI